MFISIGTPPAALTPSLTAWASVRRPRLQGIVSIQVLAIRIIGFLRSSSVEPDALEHGPRAGALDAIEHVPAHVPDIECAVAVCALAVRACHGGASYLP